MLKGMNMSATFDNFIKWWNQPFKEEMSVTNWFLFAGLILVIIWLWTRILREAGHIVGGE